MRLFVLGNNISYSLSPRIFDILFKNFGEKGEYSIIDLPPDKLPNIVEICKDYDGFNVTKPYKTQIIKYLASDKSGYASVNTVTTRDMTGYSTDGDGFLFDIERCYSGASKSNVLVVGYGGAATACVNALKSSGATVAVTGRNEQKLAEFAQKNGVSVYDDSFLPDGVVSCVTQTFVPKVKGVKFCYDLRYSGETLKLDCSSSNGLGMLVMQAIYSYCRFCGKLFDNDELKRLYSIVKESL